MPLLPGSRVGVYEVTASIGAGGMGEVYRARDSKLDRDVALKILPPEFARDAERIARFRREAKTLASINHPHIAHIHGLEENGDVLALVMELVEGEDLSQRLQRGALPIDEALPIAKQIAEALEAAHEQGIVHRDLKPANIKVRDDGTVKVLDFGLAKQGSGIGDQGSGEVSNSPTITSAAMTMRGAILGTAAYMAPEQAKGKPVDRRADIWSFGCVLYEMLSGRRAFDGEDTTEILGSIVKSDPDWNALPQSAPQWLRALVKRCLVKDRTQRLQHIGDARIELGDSHAGIETTPAVARRSPAVAVGALGATAGALIAAAVVLMIGRPAPLAERTPTRFQLYGAADEFPNGQVGQGIAMSRDGRQIAKIVEPFRRVRVWSIESGESRLLDGTAAAENIAFAPDGKRLAFRRGNQMFTIGVDGTGVQSVGELNGSIGPIAWDDDGVILAGSLRGGLKAIRADGGTASSFLEPDANEEALRAPSVIPGTHLYLYQATRGAQNGSHVMLFERDSGRRHELVAGVSPKFVNGFLVWSEQNGRSFVATFDVRTLTLGPPALLFTSEEVSASTFLVGLAVSPNGTIARLPSVAGSTSLVWVDRSGHEELPAIDSGRIWEQPRLSEDGTRLAVGNRDGGNPDIWIIELARRLRTRFTVTAGEDESPLWAHDRLWYRGGTGGLQSKPVDGSANETELKVALSNGSNPHYVSLSPDGNQLALYSVSATSGEDILSVDTKTGAVTPFVATAAAERAPMFSPDGRLIAYVSDESGRDEVYVRPFPGPGGKWQLSTNGGGEPVWNKNGRELFYREGRKLLSVVISTAPSFTAATPTRLFEGTYTESHRGYQNYDVSPDGKRFVMVKPDITGERVPIHVAVDMLGEFRRLTSQPR